MSACLGDRIATTPAIASLAVPTDSGMTTPVIAPITLKEQA